MQVIEITHPYHPTDIVDQDIVLALGFFDGVHLGHQHVIKVAQAYAKAQDLPLAVMTFDQQPKIFYSDLKASEVEYVSSKQRRTELFAELGVDYLYMVHYSHEFGSQSPQAFVDDYMVGLHAKIVVAGFDYTYGPSHLANMQTLPMHAKGRFKVVEVPELQVQTHKVGSRFILDYLKEGQLDQANLELGYIYQTHGKVIHGEKRGRTIGFPTANIQHFGQQVIPKIGVYVVAIKVENTWHRAMASIGYNVTFPGDRGLSIEVYILDFAQDIYGQEVDIRWYHYLRGEIKFDSAQGLIDQLNQDREDTILYFQAHPDYQREDSLAHEETID